MRGDPLKRQALEMRRSQVVVDAASHFFGSTNVIYDETTGQQHFSPSASLRHQETQVFQASSPQLVAPQLRKTERPTPNEEASTQSTPQLMTQLRKTEPKELAPIDAPPSTPQLMTQLRKTPTEHIIPSQQQHSLDGEVSSSIIVMPQLRKTERHLPKETPSDATTPQLMTQLRKTERQQQPQKANADELSPPPVTIHQLRKTETRPKKEEAAVRSAPQLMTQLKKTEHPQKPKAEDVTTPIPFNTQLRKIEPKPKETHNATTTPRFDLLAQLRKTEPPATIKDQRNAPITPILQLPVLRHRDTRQQQQPNESSSLTFHLRTTPSSNDDLPSPHLLDEEAGQQEQEGDEAQEQEGEGDEGE